MIYRPGCYLLALAPPSELPVSQPSSWCCVFSGVEAVQHRFNWMERKVVCDNPSHASRSATATVVLVTYLVSVYGRSIDPTFRYSIVFLLLSLDGGVDRQHVKPHRRQKGVDPTTVGFGWAASLG